MKILKEDIRVLEELKSKYLEHARGPELTYFEFENEVGRERAQKTIATLINRHGWDGRISDKNKKWAETVDALSEKECIEKRIYTNMHLAHLNQIASEARKAAENAYETDEEE